MAWIVADGFDYYNTGVAGYAQSVWDFNNWASGGSAGRFGGLCFKTGINNINCYKTMTTNEAVVYFTFAYLKSDALSAGSTYQDGFIVCYDGATAQCTVVFQANGDVVIKRGDWNGTVLATWASAFGQGVWNHYQIRIALSAAGTINIRKNGALTDTYAATGLNLISTANSYTNRVGFGGGNNNTYFDDMLIYSESGAAPNTWVGDVRAICLPAVMDTAQKNFIPFVTTTTVLGQDTNSGATVSPAANRIYWSQPWTASKNAAIGKITLKLNSTPAAGQLQCAVYDNSGPTGQPGNLLGLCTPVTNPTNVAFDNFPVNALGIPIISGRTYYVAYFANMVIGPDGWGGPNTFYLDRTYASGYPTTAPTTLSFISSFRVNFTVTSLANNAQNVGETTADGDTSYVYSATVNDADLYDLGDLAIAPFAVIGVQSKVCIKKSDAGTRNGQVLMKSGATQVAGPDTILASSYTYFNLVNTTDPATGVAWTLAGINAMLVGQKVTA